MSLAARSAPRLALPLAAERLYLSSDIGRPRAELESEFERYCFAELPHDDPWWHTEDGAGADSWAEELLEAEDELSLIDAHEPAGAGLRGVQAVRAAEVRVMPADAVRRGWEHLCWVAPAPRLLALLSCQLSLPSFPPPLPAGVFLQRVERLRQWLAARPESSIALVSHWGVLHALTGTEFDNCEVRSVRLSELRARPHLLGERNGAPAGQAA